MSLLIAETKYGAVRGAAAGGCSVFKSVRYAKPPVGPLRFCPPEPPESFSGVFDAMSFGPICPQSGHSPGSFYYKEFYGAPGIRRETSEDCLNLNIWTPAESPDEGLPVAVWIHGGAFFNGYNSEIEFDGEAYARRGVILVTINYRLGAFGFLCHPWFASGNPQGISGNWGILDQIAAINYIRENIAAFGGDPDRITVFGQSAGAISVQALLLSPLTRGLFQGAILQSGAGITDGFSPDVSLEQAMETGKRFVKILGVSSLTDLRALPWQTLQDKANELADEKKPGEHLLFFPASDGYVLPGRADALLRKGLRHNVPCLLGATADDISFTEDPAGLLKGCISWALCGEEHGLAPDYLYRFTRRLPGDDAGAFHSAELWFVFQTLGRSWRPFTEADAALSDEMISCWTEFMKTGHPPENWPPYRRAAPFIRRFDIA